jgi:hypothetical protein
MKHAIPIAIGLAMLTLAVPSAAVDAGAPGPATDTDATVVPAGHALVAEVTVTEDGHDLDVHTVPEALAMPQSTHDEAGAEDPNCLSSSDEPQPVDHGALNVAGETLAPLTDAPEVGPCEYDGQNTEGITELTLATTGAEETRLKGANFAGFIGQYFSLTCQETALATGPGGDPTTVGECETRGGGLADWEKWQFDLDRTSTDGLSYAELALE